MLLFTSFLSKPPAAEPTGDLQLEDGGDVLLEDSTALELEEDP